MKLLKYIFSTLILSWTLSVYSAPSDCQQLETDGTVNCSSANFYFSMGGSYPKFNTAQEVIDSAISLICNSYVGAYDCYAQYQNYPVYPPPGRETCSSSPTCGRYITYDPNSTSNQFFIVATVLRNTEPYYYNKHFQRSFVAYKQQNCPPNTTVVTNGGGDTPYSIWCKPNLTQYEPAACNNGCDLSSGNSSY